MDSHTPPLAFAATVPAAHDAGHHAFEPNGTATPVDVAEVFTMAARQALPRVARRHQGLAFDYHGPRLQIEGEVDSLRCCLHRLLCGMVDALAPLGVVMFSCEAADLGSHAELVATVAGAGEVVPAGQLGAIMQRLALTETTATDGWHDDHRLARGVCPATRAQIDFSCLPDEGALLRATILLPDTGRPGLAANCNAGGARAWVVDANPVGGDTLGRRLQRLGWAVTRFSSCTEAGVALRRAVPGGSRPALVIVNEREADDRAAQRLRASLPASTRLVRAVMAGSPALRVSDPIDGFEVHVAPFSPQDLLAFTAERGPLLHPPSGDTQPQPLSWADRPLVLIVDDNDLNLVIGRNLVEASGYEVITARDGAEAILQCSRMPPRVVLMDIDMPVMNGIDATRQLREMQLLGQIPPFAIVGATAGGVLASADECLQAGMDGYLTKPLRIRLLQEELRRVAALR